MKTATVGKNKKYFTILCLFLLTNHIWATPPCQIINQAFANSSDGATSDPSATGWSLSTVTGATYWACQSHRIKAQGLGTVGTWSSAVFNISGYPNVQVEVKVSSEGVLDTATEYVAIYYKLNGGALTLMQKFKGNFGTPDISSTPLNGSTVQIVIQIFNKHNGLSSYYYIENYGVNSQVKGCSLAVTPSVSGIITCSTPSVTLSPGTNTTSNVTYSWTGPNSYTSTSQNPVVSTAGTYNVTAKIAASSSTATGSVTVSQNTTVPGASASVSSTLTCSTTSVALSGSSNTSGVTYSWTGPNSFTSTLQNPSISNPGTYALTVRNPTNGCTSMASTTATQNIAVPGASANVSGPLTCTATSVTLSGSSATSGATYNWSGSNGLKSTLQNPTVTSVGIDTVTVTNPSNGCKTIASVTVTQNKTAPNVTATGAPLPCSGSITITGSSTVTSATYNWTGPNGFISATQNPTVSTTGVYTLTVTNPANGCTASDTAIVVQGIAIPGVTATVNGVLTCITTSVTLSGNAGISGVTYSWSGSGSFTSSLQNPVVSIPGTYTLTVSNPDNGCTSMVTTTVTQNTTLPGATASVSGLITCSTTSVALSGSSSTSGVIYSWSGPNSFSSTSQSPGVSAVGTYILTVTNPANGCVSTATTSVTRDTASPGVTASVNGTVGCANHTATLSGNSATLGVTYAWTGPNSFTSASQNTSVSNPGSYTVTTTNPSNGCTSTASVTVVQNSEVPGAIAGGGGTITCTTPSVALTGSSDTSGVTYSWTGPNSFTSSLQNPLVTSGGTYTLTVTNPTNGCTSTASVTVTQNTTPPGATANGGVLTCIVTSVSLSGSSSTSGVAYSWSGPGSFDSTLQNPTVNTAGSYTFSVTNPTNGCTSTATATVSQNITAPGVTATGGNLSCTATTVTLGGSSTTSGVTYAWTGPNNFSSSLQNPTVSTLGTYSLTVTNPANGCTSTTIASVAQNTTPPGATAGNGGTLTCTNTSLALSGSSNASGVTYSWAGPNGFTSTLQNPSVSSPGIYTLTVTSTANNCTSSTWVNVLQNIVKPGVKASNNGTLTCGTTSVTLTASSATPSATFSWSGFTAGANPVTTSSSGKYFVTAINPINGCTNVDSTLVSRVANSTAYQFMYNNFSTYTAGTISDNTTNGWYLDRSQVPNVTSTYGSNITPHYFAIYSHRVAAQQLGGQGIWYSKTMNVAGKPDYQIGIKITSEGTLNSNEYVKLSYKLDGGNEIVWDQRTGYFGTVDFRSPILNSNTVQIIVRIYNYGKGGSTVSNYYVEEEQLYIAGCGGTLVVYPAVSGNLTCANPSVKLSVTTSHSGATYQWTGPNGFTSTQQFPVITTAGTYNVTATIAPSSTATGSVTVNQNITTPGATATVADTLTCSKTYVTLSGNSPTSGVCYSWMGPNGFVSSQKNPIVTSPGTYTLTVTNPINGCASTDSVTVVQINTIPGASVTINDSITCTKSSVIITGNFTSSGVTYSWTGPNGFTSTLQSPTVSVPGTYTLTVANSSTGCTSTASGIVKQSSTPPGVTATGGALTCTTSSVTLTGNSSTSGVTYDWSGPNSFTSTLQNPTVSSTGTYTLTVTNPANGCTSTASATVSSNTTSPGATASGGTITCTNTSVTIAGSSSTSGVTYSWNGPNSFASTIQNPSVSSIGTYNLTVTNPTNGCTSTALATVYSNTTTPSATASGGTITCTNTSVTLAGSSSTSGVTYSWNGTNSFTSTLQNPTVSNTGTYTLKVTNPTNGCTSTASATVSSNTTAPGATVSGGTITCTNTSVTLAGSSSTSGVTYSWNGPNSFTSTLQNPTVSSTGAYTLKVTNPANGCTSTASTTVSSNTTAPGATASGGTITCTNTSVTLAGGSSTSGVTYSWSGPNSFTSTLQNPTVSSTGTYTLTVTNPANGCTSTASATVSSNTTAPGATASGGIITCTNTSVTLAGSSSISGVTYSWSGPNSFTSTIQNPSVSSIGAYSLTVTNPANGCTSAASATVSSNTTAPGATASGGIITCTNTSVTLAGSSSISGVTYSWSGPGSFASTIQNPSVSSIGTYNLTITNPANGCTSTASATVSSNTTTPGATASGGTLTCSITSVALSGSSSTSGVSYSWTGPGSFTSTSQNPTVSNAGTYNLTVTNPANGCISNASAIVTQSNTLPNVSTSVDGMLTCTTTSVILSGNSSTSGVTYHWSGPLIFSSTEQSPATAHPGSYSLTVTDPSNGCTSVSSITVNQDTSTATGVNTTVSGSLTCLVSSVTLTGSSTTSGTTYSWTGPNGFSSANQNIVVSSPGNYVLHVTKQSNGCVTIVNRTVAQDTAKPVVVVEASGILSCTASSVILTGSSATNGLTYNWIGPDFTSTSAISSVTNPGTYTLTATNPSNGCISVKNLTVVKDLSLPTGVATSVSGILTCATPSVNVSATSTTPNVVYSWSGPGNYTSIERTPQVGSPGTYSVIVTNPYNNCSVTNSIDVSQNIIAPDGVQASVSGLITCANTTVTLSSTSSTLGVTYNWIGPSGFTSAFQNPIVSLPGNYTLTVTNTSNGCQTVKPVTVSENTVPPANINANASGTLNCLYAFVTLTGTSSTVNAEYNWTGPDNFDDPNNITFVVEPGVYKLTVTNPENGCSDSTSINVAIDTVAPVAHIIPPASSPIALSNNPLSAQVVNNVSYLWTFSSANPNWAIISGDTTPNLTYHAGNAGTSAIYNLTVTSKQNGCSSSINTSLTAVLSAKSSSLAKTNTAIDETTNEVSLLVYPNPFASKAIIEFTPEQDGQANVELYRAQGSLSRLLFNSYVNKSQSYNIVVDGTTMPVGSYYCIIRLNNHVYSCKLLLVR